MNITQREYWFGENPDGAVLQQADYQDGTDVRYDVSGWPPIRVTIYDYHLIGIVTRNTIRADMITKGFVEGPEYEV